MSSLLGVLPGRLDASSRLGDGGQVTAGFGFGRVSAATKGAGSLVVTSSDAGATEVVPSAAPSGATQAAAGSSAGPDVTDPQGDELIVDPPYPAYATGNLQTGTTIYCNQELGSGYGGELVGICAPLFFHDSVTGSQVPGQNTESTRVYDACGALVATWSGQNLHGIGSPFLTMPADAGGPVVLPSSGVCWGQWTATVSFSETFTDGQQLSDSNSSTFAVTANPPPPPAPPSAVGVGAGAATVHNPSPCGGDPVNCASGNFSETYRDVSIAGRGPGLDLTRTYNSLSASSSTGIFGHGWISSYEAHLVANGDGSVTVTEGDGSQVTAVPSGGGYSIPTWAASTLTRNGDGSWTFLRQQTTMYTFDSSGRLVAIKDRNGYTTQLAYDGSGQLSTVTDSAGRAITFTFGPNGFVAQVADPMSQTTSYGYDAAGDLTSVTDPMQRQTSFGYDGGHLLQTVTDPRQGVTTNVYDGSGRVTQQTDPANLVTHFAYAGDNYSSFGGTTTITDPHGSVTVESYTNGFMLTKTVASGTPVAGTWSYQYDPNTFGVTSVTDPNNHTTTRTYDAAGNTVAATDALNRTATSTYNTFNEPLTVTDPASIKTTYTYDPAGNILTKAVTGAGGSPTETTTYSYGDSSHPGDVTEITDPAGHITDYGYDLQGDLTTRTTHPASGVNNTTGFVYDVLGRKVCEASPAATAAGVQCPPAGQPSIADTTTWSYNADSEVSSSSDPLGNTTSFSYDGDGNRVQVSDPLGKVTKTVFDADSRTTSVTPGYGTAAASTTGYVDDLAPGSGACSGSVTGATYCTTTTDPAGQVTVDYFNARNEQIQETQPSSGTSSSTYDASGNLATTTTAGGTATYGYDAADQLTSITYSNPGAGFALASNVGYAYDPDGRRTSMTDGTGTTSSIYDPLGRLQSITNGAGATVSYGYDSDNEITSTTYPGRSQTVTQTWDGSGRESSLTDWLNHTTSFGYDADGNLQTEALPNGTTISSSYDNADNLLSTAQAPNANPSSPIASFAYSYNADQQVKTETDTGTPAPTSQSYSYDQVSRLSSSSSASYGYTSSGDPTQLGAATQTFNNAHQVTSQAATITRVGTTSAGDNGTGSTLTLSLPAGTAANDQILLAVTLPGSQSIKQTPSGYSAVGTYSTGTGASNVKLVLYRRTAQAGDASTTVTFSKTFAKSASLIVYRGVNPATPIDVSSSGTTASGTSVTAPSVTTTKANDQLVLIDGAESASSGSWTAPSGMTTRVSRAGGPTTTGSIADQTLGAAGAIGSRTATFSVSGSLAAVLIALQPTSTTYSYDGLGDRTGITTPAGTTTLAYNQLGRMTADGTTSYTYDGDGLRASKKIGHTTTSFAWLSSGATSVPLLLVDGATDYVYGPEGQPLEQVNGTTVLYYLHDQLGSARALTNAAGSLAATYTYKEFGSLVASTGSAINSFGFAGGYTDAESGLLYLQNRYYDPASGQFNTVDPLVDATGTAYGYATDDPTDQTDPTGLGVLGDFENFYVGAADTLTFGLTKSTRGLLGGDNINYCSTAYRAGGTTALAVGLAIPGEGEIEAAAEGGEEAARLAKAFQGGGRAPELSRPYGIHTILDDAGNVKQVTTYDRFGRRAHQYDIGPGTRHGEGSHTFEYGPGSERGARGEHVPF